MKNPDYFERHLGLKPNTAVRMLHHAATSLQLARSAMEDRTQVRRLAAEWRCVGPEHALQSAANALTRAARKQIERATAHVLIAGVLLRCGRAA